MKANFSSQLVSFGFNCFSFDYATLCGRVVRAFALGALDLGLILSRVKPMTLKLVFTASLRDA